MRKAKRENRIAKYFVDFDGSVSVLVNLSDSVTVRLTRLSGVMEPRAGAGPGATGAASPPGPSPPRPSGSSSRRRSKQ